MILTGTKSIVMRSILSAESKIFLVVFMMLSIQARGEDSCWTVLLLKKGNTLEIKPDMGAVSKTGFYLYRNCVYDVSLKNSQNLHGRLTDIRQDTLFFTNYFNANAASKAGATLDTLAIHYTELAQLSLISDRAMGFYTKVFFDDYDFIFRKDTVHCLLASHWHPIYTNDPAYYEVVPHLTAQGVDLLFEESGRTYYYYGPGMVKPDRSKMDDTYDRKNVFWFTPCRVEEINGIALGLHTKNTKNDAFNERDSLVVRGLALEINPFAIFGLLSPQLNGPYPDSMEMYHQTIQKDWRVKINGVNISVINTINEMQIRGLNITGVLTVVDEIHGVSVSGINNFCYVLNGVSIAIIRNRATVARGVQIGLFNKANDLRGVQIGLWNKNGKRSFPLINWQFKAAKKK